MRVFLPLIVSVVLVVYALVDCIRTPDDEIPAGMPKMLWIILVVVFPPFGAIAWIVASRVSRSRARGSGSRPGFWSSPGPAGPSRPRGPVAPDDDPEFLARIERERRRAERERKAREEQGSDDHDAGAESPEQRPAGEGDEARGADDDPPPRPQS